MEKANQLYLNKAWFTLVHWTGGATLSSEQ